MQALQCWLYAVVDQYVFDFPQWKVDEMFYVVHVLLVLVLIICIYMWYTYYKCGYLVCTVLCSGAVLMRASFPEI
jgi:hypothetical protein